MRYALFLHAAVALLLVGCSEKKDEPTVTCSARVDCPNERASAKAEECPTAIADPNCGAAYRVYYDCFQRRQVCDGRGLVDQDASTARCSDFADAWGQCLGPGTVDTGGAVDTTVEDTSIEEDTRPFDTKPDTAPED
jgi:hypothetical protein